MGPTVDDVTRQAIAAATDRELVFHQSLYDAIAARFSTFKVKMTDNNRRQAYLPENAIVVENPVGTAPSFIVEHEGSVAISLPGVPREMKYLMTHRIVPYLLDKYQLGIIKARILRTAGIGESTLDDRIGEDLLQQSNPTIGLAAHQGMVDVRVTVKADTDLDADQLLDQAEVELRERIGDFVFGTDDDELEIVLQELLIEQQSQISIIEAGIETPISERLTHLQGNSNILESITFYASPEELSDYGTVTLRELAIRIAETHNENNDAVATMVILSQPDIDENADSEQSTIVAVSVDGETRSRVYGFGARHELAREWVSRWSMAALWQMLRKKYYPESSAD